MKFSIAAALALAASVNAHAIMQKVSVDGQDQGLLTGIRAPRENNPTESVTDSNMICDSDGSTSSTIIPIKGGSRLGFYWQHVIGGPQFSGDPDNPIAPSHKGPIQVYFAKVDNAASASKNGLKWFKVASEGLNNGVWAVDKMFSAGGWWYMNVPSCLAEGDYLARVELLALHNAYTYPGAQFYMSCPQFRLSNAGSYTPSNTVSFPGAYSSSDPGISLNIYGTGGVANNGGRAYTAPGPAVITCPAGGSPATTTTSRAAQQTTTMRTTTRSTTQGGQQPTTTPASTGGCTSAQWQQCGGNNFSGCTTCSGSFKCVKLNDYYSQCQ